MCVIVTEVRARAAPGLHAKPPTALPPASMEPPAGRLFFWQSTNRRLSPCPWTRCLWHQQGLCGLGFIHGCRQHGPVVPSCVPPGCHPAPCIEDCCTSQVAWMSTSCHAPGPCMCACVCVCVFTFQAGWWGLDAFLRGWLAGLAGALLGLPSPHGSEKHHVITWFMVMVMMSVRLQ